MHPFAEALQTHFEPYRNPKKAEPMARYMRNQYPFLGIQTPERRRLLREFLQQAGTPPLAEIPKIIRCLWSLPEREYPIVALDLLDKYKKQLNFFFLPLLEELITNRSWWDTVDGLAVQFVGGIFAKEPQLIADYIPKWMASGNIWLQRTAILFQLKYKERTDTELLFSLMTQLSSSKEFFIQKAIGWALREYAKTAPDTVWQFVQSHPLAPLSKREAIKHIKNRYVGQTMM